MSDEVTGELIEQKPTSRSLSVERTYSLGQYQNIKLFDSINQLPYEIMLDQEMINKIRYLQLIDLELTYRQYTQLYEQIHGQNTEDAMIMLQALRTDTMDQIKNLFENKEE